MQTNKASVTAEIKTKKRGSSMYVAVIELSGPLEDMQYVDVDAVLASLDIPGLIVGRVYSENEIVIDCADKMLSALLSDTDTDVARAAREALDGDGDGASSEQVAAMIVERA